MTELRGLGDRQVIILNFLNNVGCDRGSVDIGRQHRRVERVGRWHRYWICDAQGDTSVLEVILTELRGLGERQVMILNFL
jgi:hypothetical protein